MHDEANDTNICTGERCFAQGIKLEFPKSSGLNPLAWLYRAN